ncbi:hypothetical protein [Rubrobacter radiotolerans]|nr:hypothetical protein [Rubrobacter radiotolerans]MDX5893640.1 hypothetical protein [Rubrobacter radiotolerans]SMC04171.1 conserved hypothetical protein [Rubrobacter radiotolerans DSM 5868]
MKDALYEIAFRNSRRYEELAERAERTSDDELAEFFRRTFEEEVRRAAEARTLLAQRVAE